MDHLQSLYPESPGYSKDSDTSHGAALAIEKPSVADRARALALFQSGWSGTDWELSISLGIAYERAQPRRSELTATGSVIDSGERSANSRSGLRATVWKFRPKDEPIDIPKWKRDHENWKPAQNKKLNADVVDKS